MLSKILPWDFIQKHPKTLDVKAEGPQAFLIDDPYIERVILDRLPKKEIPFSLYTGSEFTRDFIEEHFVNLSFFSSSDHIMIMNAENISKDVLEFLLETDIDWSGRYLLLFFTKTSKSFTEFVKNKKVIGIEIEMPRFWEGVKMWQFAQKVREINLDATVTRFALENLEHNFESFFWLIDTIKVNFPAGKVDLKQLQELVSRERYDFFELIDLFHKGPKFFFQEVLKKEEDFDWMRGLASFMQTHLVKVLYPEEVRAKGKLSKYDQSILEMSEKLNRSMVKSYMDFFSEMEVLAKANDAFLINRLRMEALR